MRFKYLAGRLPPVDVPASGNGFAAVWAGVVAVMLVELFTVNPVAPVPPKATAVAPVNPVPVIVTLVPPAVLP